MNVVIHFSLTNLKIEAMKKNVVYNLHTEDDEAKITKEREK